MPIDCRDLSLELAAKEGQVKDLLCSMASLQKENATLWHEAQQGLALAASLADMHQRLQVASCPVSCLLSVPVDWHALPDDMHV